MLCVYLHWKHSISLLSFYTISLLFKSFTFIKTFNFFTISIKSFSFSNISINSLSFTKSFTLSVVKLWTFIFINISVNSFNFFIISIKSFSLISINEIVYIYQSFDLINKKVYLDQYQYKNFLNVTNQIRINQK